MKHKSTNNKNSQNVKQEVKTPSKPLSPLEQKYLDRWNDLSNFLNRWYYKPDLETIRAVYAVYISHYYYQDPPVWTFVIGAARSGKTTLCIDPLLQFKESYTISDLSTNSFLSGYGDGRGILNRLKKETNGNGVLLFPDFSTFLSERPEDRGKIGGQLRRIYDGEYEKEVGNKRKPLQWKGKVTCIAACTPNIEEYWALNRGLGERFMYLRWKQQDAIKVALKSVEQIGFKEDIVPGVKERVSNFLDIDNDLKEVEMLSPEKWEETGLIHLGVVVAQLRACVKREVLGAKRSIIGVDVTESPTTIAQSCAQVARAHATMFRRGEINGDDMAIGRKLAIDSIPPQRLDILREVYRNVGHELPVKKLREVLKIPSSTLNRHIEDLQAIGYIGFYFVGEAPELRKVLTIPDDIAERLKKCQLFRF